MISELFAHQYPLIITSGFTSACVMILSFSNLFGRLFWSSLSDYLGRRTIYTTFTIVSVPLYLSLPLIVTYWLPYTTSVLPLAAFITSSCIIVTFFGGVYSVTPAYETDLFGSKYFGAIHGLMLTASSVGAIFGPVALAKLRELSKLKEIKKISITN